jgi:hypothetical protein
MKLLLNVQERFKNVKRIFNSCKKFKMKMITKRKVRKVKNSPYEHTKTTGNSTLGSDQEFEELTNEYGELIEESEQWLFCELFAVVRRENVRNERL